MSARILVIEDNPANLELMTYLLRAYKYEPLSAMDGESGLAAAQAQHPDIVVCDIQLPRMDGFEVVRQLKSDAATASIPVIAVTAFAMVGDRDRALAGGFDGYIGKPIVPETFVLQVEHFLGTRSSAEHAAQADSKAAPVAPARHAGARILVIDNTAANRQLMESTLAPFGYDVVTVANVAAALMSARGQVPDLIISDVHMPGQSGLDLLAQVKADPRLSTVPFVFASASLGDEREQRQAIAAGADAFLLRPCAPKELLQQVEKLLGSSGKGHGENPRR
jgi:two-component system, cell cycle response regulator